MRSLKIIILILFCTATSLAFAEDKPKELLDGLPDEIAVFCAGKTIRNDSSVRRKYRYKDMQINIELYEMNTSIPDGYNSKKIKEIKDLHLKSARDTKMKVGYEGGKEMNLTGGRKIKFLFSRFLTTDYARILLDLYLTGIKGYVCKIWATREGVISFRKEKRIQDAVRVIFSELTKPAL